MTTLTQIKESVILKYNDLYPNWTDIRITETIKIDGDGYYLVIRAKENSNDTDGEICFVDNQTKVTIFSTTEELIRFLNSKQNKKWYQLLFSKTGISAIVTLVLLTTLCILVFRPGQSDPQVLQIIGGAFLAAIGFLFGTSSNSKSS